VSEHIVPRAVYVLIGATLLLFTGITYYAATVDLNHIFPGLNVIVALTIATFKATLVVLYFMHARYSPQRTQLVVISGVFWLAILLGLTLSDYLTRPWFHG
jgi:cytochrome c oxidase subunit 4